MIDHISNRKEIIQALTEELLGPSPAGHEIDCTKLPLTFDSYESAFGPFIEKSSGEEIIVRDYPTKRYGIGVLYPFGTKDEEIILIEAGKDSIGRIVNQDDDELKIYDQDDDETAEKRSKSIGAISESLSNFQSDENPDD